MTKFVREICCELWEPKLFISNSYRHEGTGMSRSMLKLGERALRDMEITRPFGRAQGGLEWLSVQPSGSATASTPSAA